MKYSDVKNIADQIPGWLSNKEAKLLFTIANNCSGKGVIVEIGSYKGKSTVIIGNGAKNANIKKVYSIDPHIGNETHRNKFGEINTFEDFKKNCSFGNISDIVVPIVDFSANSIDKVSEPIEFLFIDGDHEYKAVKLDFDLWFPKVMKGGIIAFHDTNAPGPGKVSKDGLYKSRKFKKVKFVDTLTYGIKVRENNSTDRLINRINLHQRNLRNIVVAILSKFPKPVKRFGKAIINRN